MRFRDKQLGVPIVLYKDTKSTISAMTPEVWSLAFAIDTNEIGLYTSSGWIWSTLESTASSGDMLKAVYDTNNDGAVDFANFANFADWANYGDWNGVANPPASYYPDAHADSHKNGNYDEIKLDELGVPSDNTNLNATTTRHGLLPKLSGNASQYLNGLGQWSVPAGGGGSINFITSPILYTDCLYANTAALATFYGVAVSSGTLNAPNSGVVTSSTIGVLRLRSSTTANGGYYIASSPAMFLPVVGMRISGGFYFNNFSTTTFRFGIHSSTTSAAPADGIYFQYSASGVIDGRVTRASSTTVTTTSYTASLSTWYRLTFTVTSSNQVTFTIYNYAGTQLWSDSVTATLPSNATAFCCIATESSTTATDILHVDYLLLEYTGGVIR